MQTQTNSPTATVEATATNTPANTPTATAPATNTPAQTNTHTPTNTATQTPTATMTPTNTQTPTTTNTATRTSTPTVRPTPEPGALSENFESAQYFYDGNGTMVKSIIDGVTTYYVGGYFELQVEGTTETETKYYNGPTGRFAMRVEGVLYWIFSDHLQSSSVVLEENGTVFSRTSYTAFGEIRNQTGTSPTDYQYTGQRSYLDDFGLHYYVARWYDPYLNQFIQPDSLIPDPGNSADWNRYAYVNYNPINFNDPTGHSYSGDDEWDRGTLESEDEIYQYYMATQSSDPNILKQDTLFSYMFLGSGANGEWLISDWVYYYDNRKKIWNNPQLWLNPDPESVDGFIIHVERLASHYDEGEVDEFVRDFALVFGGIAADNNWLTAAFEVSRGPKEYLILNESNNGLHPDYEDDEHLGSNQSHHYAGIFFLSYFTRNEYAAMGMNFLRDPKNPGDILLGNLATRHATNFGARNDPMYLVTLLYELKGE